MGECGCEKIEVEMEQEKARVWVPVDSDLSEFELGAEVEILIKGRIEGGSFHLKKEVWEESKGRINVEIDSVIVSGKTVFESLVE